MVDFKKITSVFIIGSGPIIIGQAGEFDYSGTQACKALKAAGYRIILLNSNPATIMTDPEIADVVYLEALNLVTIERILAKERPDALLATMGGQLALNYAIELEKQGILAKYQVALLGANSKVIEKAESRAQFRAAMLAIGLQVPKAYIAHNMQEVIAKQQLLGFPLVIRPSYTLGGSGGGIAFNKEELVTICQRGLAASATQEILLEEALLGYKEFELEVVRDSKDNCLVICTIENMDPMGIHTGDSITVAPAQTLTDKQYQQLRDAAILILREIGVETGGANIQFAIEPNTGKQVVIEMNPRVSRSSALASKATGVPIAKIAALLAVGFTLEQLKNDISSGVFAAFEPAMDYVVTKIPRFNGEKFLKNNESLTTQMQSVGEVMAVGRTFQASLQKALNSLELEIYGLLGPESRAISKITIAELKIQLQNPGALRILYLAEAFRRGLLRQEIYALTFIDPWFLAQIQELIFLEREISNCSLLTITKAQLMQWKQQGFADSQLAKLLKVPEKLLRRTRAQVKLKPIYKKIDSCAGEFLSNTAYLYSAYDYACEAQPTNNKKILILGSGPNRIGQGVEFDYCCVKALQAFKKFGYETIMVNCNPETVATDYDVADRLYFEPLTLESVMDIIAIEQPNGVVLQFGGQTPLKLAKDLAKLNINILGTNFASINCTENRREFSAIMQQLAIKQPENAIISSSNQAKTIAKKLGFPLIIRPSYVLGGTAMSIVFNETQLCAALANKQIVDNFPILIEQYLENAIEIELDGISDEAGNLLIAGIMEHIEPAGIHSGDSSCVLPTISISKQQLNIIKYYARKLVKQLKIVGFVNIQFASYQEQIYVLEVNPRVSRTIPFLAKALAIPYIDIAVKCLLGGQLTKQEIMATTIKNKAYYCVKHPVIPFNKFPTTILQLGPNMRATGEVMGIDTNFLNAYKKAHEGLTAIAALTTINIFLACSKQELYYFIEELRLLLTRRSAWQRVQLYCVANLATEFATMGVTIKIITDLAILPQLCHNCCQLLIITQQSEIGRQILPMLSKDIIQNNLSYALTMQTAKIMLQALVITDTKEVVSLQEWKNYLLASNE